MNKKLYKSGEKSPVSGQYSLVDENKEPAGREYTVVEGEPFPPTQKKGQGYILSDVTLHDSMALESGSRLPARLVDLKLRIDKLVQGGGLSERAAEKLVNRWAKLFEDVETEKDNIKLEPKVARLTAHITYLETPPTLAKQKQQNSEKASRIMTALSIIVFVALVSSNWLSMIFVSSYKWPNGWFISDKFLGFALAGVSINILLRLRTRVQRGDWADKYIGTHVSRILQATVYAAVIYWLVSALPDTESACLEKGLDANCWQTRANMPFALSGLFVGLFVNLLEEALKGIGERFVDMISALFSSQFEGPRSNEVKNQELRKQLEVVSAQYAGVDISELSDDKKQTIEQLFADALSLLQSNENDQAEQKIQELTLEIKNAT